VYPTAFYETVISFIFFGVLWALRKRLKPFGALFALYLILNGVERFLIEKIRVNNKMDFLGFQPTQAEVISIGLIITGVVLWIILAKKYNASPLKV
jgi:prolipoprotein diacylglyceryltransferase